VKDKERWNFQQGEEESDDEYWWKLAGWLYDHSFDGHPFRELNNLTTGFDTDTGRMPVDELRENCEQHVCNSQWRVSQIAGMYGFRVDFTPPYWPQLQPVELLWANLKFDWRSMYDAKDRKDVPRFVRTFAMAVNTSDLRGWCEKAETYARAVRDRDASVLAPLELEHISRIQVQADGSVKAQKPPTATACAGLCDVA
jgi:hypothetical protein